MKQIHIRRFLSLLLAALTLWAAAVTAGSDSAAAALQQLRQGSRLPQQALRWELGDFFGLDSLSAVTVMTLAQSPLLLAGRSTVAALLSAGVTRDPPKPVAPESPDTLSSCIVIRYHISILYPFLWALSRKMQNLQKFLWTTLISCDNMRNQ